MSEKHTPGPWKVEGDYPCIATANGYHVVCFGHDYDDYGGIQAPFHGKIDSYDSPRAQAIIAINDAEQAANARLIAAAPQLLEALELAYGVLKMRSNFAIEPPEAVVVRAAIDAAKGT